MGDVLDATDQALRAATHLTTQDAGAVAALRVLALKIDAIADVQAGVTVDGQLFEDIKRGMDNVTIPTYLKYSESLGLTPSGRKALAEKKSEAPRANSVAQRREATRHLRPA